MACATSSAVSQSANRGSFSTRPVPIANSVADGVAATQEILIDGFVHLDADETPGLGQHLFHALGSLTPEELKLGSRDEVFDTFLKLHPKLKERYFLNTKEHDSDPHESSQFSILIANVNGIFGVESYREVFEFERFWAIGSGRRSSSVTGT